MRKRLSINLNAKKRTDSPEPKKVESPQSDKKVSFKDKLKGLLTAKKKEITEEDTTLTTVKLQESKTLAIGLQVMKKSKFSFVILGYDSLMQPIMKVDSKNMEHPICTLKNEPWLIEGKKEQQQALIKLKGNTLPHTLIHIEGEPGTTIKPFEKVIASVYDPETQKVLLQCKFDAPENGYPNWKVLHLYYDSVNWNIDSVFTPLGKPKDNFDKEHLVLDKIQRPLKLNVKIVQGHRVKDKDSNTYDSQVEVRLGNEKYVTKEVKELHPIYDEQFTFKIPEEIIKEINLDLMDSKKKKVMGSICVTSFEIEPGRKYFKPIIPKEEGNIGAIEFIIDFDKTEPLVPLKIPLYETELSTIMLRRHETENIPKQIKEMLDFLEIHGPNYVGIFRIAGLKDFRDQWAELCDQGLFVPFPSGRLLEDGVHDIASLFKQWMRTLPTPLLTFEKYEDFIKAVSLEDEIEKHKLFRKLVSEIPTCHQDLLFALLKLCKTIELRKEENKMNAENLAVVFGVGTLSPKNDEMRQIQDINAIQKVFITLLDIFPGITEKLKEEHEKNGELLNGSSVIHDKKENGSVEMETKENGVAHEIIEEKIEEKEVSVVEEKNEEKPVVDEIVAVEENKVEVSVVEEGAVNVVDEEKQVENGNGEASEENEDKKVDEKPQENNEEAREIEETKPTESDFAPSVLENSEGIKQEDEEQGNSVEVMEKEVEITHIVEEQQVEELSHPVVESPKNEENKQDEVVQLPVEEKDEVKGAVEVSAEEPNVEVTPNEPQLQENVEAFVVEEEKLIQEEIKETNTEVEEETKESGVIVVDKTNQVDLTNQHETQEMNDTTTTNDVEAVETKEQVIDTQETVEAQELKSSEKSIELNKDPTPTSNTKDSTPKKTTSVFSGLIPKKGKKKEGYDVLRFDFTESEESLQNQVLAFAKFLRDDNLLMEDEKTILKILIKDTYEALKNESTKASRETKCKELEVRVNMYFKEKLKE